MKRWIVVAALTFARTALGFQFQSVAAVAPLLAADLGLDKTQLGWLMGIYLLPGVAVALPGGLLGARFGDRRLVLAGLALMAAGGVALALATSPIVAELARLASGIGGVVLNVLITKMVADRFDGRERLLAMSLVINAWPIGISAALLTVGPIAAAFDWRWGIASTALLAVAGSIVVWAAVARDARRDARATPLGLGLDLLTPREWSLLAVASLPWMLFNAAFQIVVSFLPLFFVESGANVARAGALSALNTLLVMMSVQAGGVVLKRSTRPDAVCHLAIVAWSATLILLSASPSPIAWLVMGGIVCGIPASAYVTLPAEFLRPETRGVGLGVFYTIYYAGCAVLPSAAGALYDAAGSPSAALWLAAGLALACVPAHIAFRRMLEPMPRLA